MKKALRPSHGILDQNAAFFRITTSFWKLYMPLFEARSTAYGILMDYFSGVPVQHSLYSDLEYAMTQMVLRDERVAWLAFYSPNRETNYILLADTRQLHTFGADFPYLTQLSGRNMTVLGMEKLPHLSLQSPTFALCGGIPFSMGEGHILAGYRITPFEKICRGYDFLLDSMRYELISGGHLVYSSSGDELPRLDVSQAMTGIVQDHQGERYFVQADMCGDKDSFLLFSSLNSEMNAYRHRLTLPILLLVFLFAGFSVLFYLLTLRVITREVNIIRQGLRRISENDMSTPIQSDFIQAGLYSIAQAVNDMAQRLDRTLNRAHYYQLRQKEAELSELQSKYNPHFLYNTLEMLRNRCELAGVSDVADLITDFSAIFRGLIGSKTFIPMREELAFTRRYLSLPGARYADQVTIRYDFTRDVLRYGIIRNVFQPLIENYFQYGFDAASPDNEILLRGELLENGLMALTVEDNGSGMSEGAIAALRFKLSQSVQNSQESYGLKNLHQRLRLFYGEDCGLTVDPSEGCGLKVRIIARAMTCEEYENNQSLHSTLKEEDFHENRHRPNIIESPQEE